MTRLDPMRTLIIAVIALALSPGLALAGGFILNDHGAKATGRADSVVATVDDGSAIFYNPAGIAVRDGANVYLGGTLILPFASFTEAQTGEETDAERRRTITPNVYAYGRLTDLVSIGIGAYTPFGSSSEWPASSPGREISRNTTLRTLFISPVLGFNLSRYVPGTLTVAGGFDLVPADVELERDILFGETVGTAHLGGDGLGWGGRVGVQYSPNDDWAFGVAYRSEVELDFNGTGDFDIEAPFRSALPPDGDIAATLTLPQSVLAGVAYRPPMVPNLEVELDLNWIDWRSFEELAIELPDGSVSTAPQDWNDVFVWRLGAEYALPQHGAAVRAGYGYDPTPIPDSTLGFTPPDANRHVVSIGGSYDLPQNFYVDAGFLYGIPVDNRTSDEPLMPQIKGEVDITFYVFGLSLGYQFGGEKRQESLGTPAGGPVITKR